MEKTAQVSHHVAVGLLVSYGFNECLITFIINWKKKEEEEAKAKRKEERERKKGEGRRKVKEDWNEEEETARECFKESI